MPATMTPRAEVPAKRYFKPARDGNGSPKGEPAKRGAFSGASNGPKGAYLDDAKILFQSYFKSVGPRTYAAQLKEVANGNHVLVLTEGRRDKNTGEVRKTKFLVWSEDFRSFFDLLRETAAFIKTNPVPEEVRERQAKRWAKEEKERSATK